MKRVMIVILLLGVSALLAACSTGAGSLAQSQTPQPWTQAELDNVLDLSELGEVGYTEAGVTVGGKLLPSQPGNWANVGYGRTFNYLRLNDNTLNALPTDVRDFFLEASPDQLRGALSEIKVSIVDIRQLQALSPNGNIPLQAFMENIYSVAKAAGKADLFNVSRLNLSNRPDLSATQTTYGITGRTTVDASVGDCNIGSGSFRVRSVSATTSNKPSYYLAAKTTLVIGGVTRSDSTQRESFGPVSSVTDTFNYTHPCQKVGERTSATGYHKGKYKSTSTAIIKYSNW